MDGVERISVELPTALADELRDAVACADHASLDAAVEQAVEPWTVDRMVARIGVDTLREHWERGIASGPASPLDFDAFRVEAA